MDIYREAELRVLRHLVNNPDELIPEGMEEFEFNATCDNLEARGCIWVAWSSGHHAEAVRVYDRGRMRLKELEQDLQKEKDDAAVREIEKARERFRTQRRERAQDNNTQLISENVQLKMELKQAQEEISQLKNDLEKANQEIERLKALLPHAPKQAAYDRSKVIAELSPFFKGSQESAGGFLDQIDGYKPKEITALVNNYRTQNLLDTSLSSMSFHKILHKHGIYDRSYQTWNSQVKWS